MATRDRDGRQMVRAVKTIASSRAKFLAWLDDNAGGEEKLAKALNDCRDSPDPRVKVQAVKLEAQIRGYLQPDEQQAQQPSIHFHLGVPKTREPLEAEVVDVEPREDDDD